MPHCTWVNVFNYIPPLFIVNFVWLEFIAVFSDQKLNKKQNRRKWNKLYALEWTKKNIRTSSSSSCFLSSSSLVLQVVCVKENFQDKPGEAVLHYWRGGKLLSGLDRTRVFPPDVNTKAPHSSSECTWNHTARVMWSYEDSMCTHITDPQLRSQRGCTFLLLTQCTRQQNRPFVLSPII